MAVAGSAAIEQTKEHRRRFLYPRFDFDQVTLSADPFRFRRFAIKLRPQKPRISIAQIEGSGTADIVASIVPLELSLLLAVSVKV
jgi:hypothetical protein